MDVDVQSVPVAGVLGMYISATTFELLQLFGVNSVCVTGLLMSGLRFGLGGYRVALTIIDYGCLNIRDNQTST